MLWQAQHDKWSGDGHDEAWPSSPEDSVEMHFVFYGLKRFQILAQESRHNSDQGDDGNAYAEIQKAIMVEGGDSGVG